MAESGAHLTTSRVNRLLRPLRNKCNSLVALPQSASVFRVTCSKQSSNWDPNNHPPLSLFFFSAGTRKLTLDRRSTDEVELSRRIHAVCDAFKNIVHAAFGRPCIERIPSLAATCTLVVGENMPASNSLAGSSGDSADDMLDVDSIYEAVPSHYRRFLIVSHALSMVLRICIHHHTLVTILLDHCLSFGLVHESTRLLNIILTQAFLPSNPSNPPPVTHPGHMNYLSDLHTRWTNGNKPSGTSSDILLFTTSAFCQVLLNTLSQSPCHLYAIWTSMALNRLLQTVEKCDIDAYTSITRALAQSFCEDSKSVPDTIREDPQVTTLKDKLSEMMSKLFDLLFSQHSSTPTQLRIHSAVDILYDCHAARLHRVRTSTSSSPIDLPDIITIFTTHVFVTFRDSIQDFSRLLTILDDSSPIPATFSKLMIYFSRPQEGHAFEDVPKVFLSRLELYSSALRSEKLFRLDASLWACSLRHFETSIATFQKDRSVVLTQYKRQLMEAVEKAERRCFGGAMNDSPVISTVHPTRTRRTHYARTSGHWEWEDMVGSWVRRTPVHKRRRIDDGCLHTPLRHYCSRSRGAIPFKVASSTSVSTSSSVHHQHSSSSPSFLSSQFSDPTEDGSEYQETDKENYPGDSPQVAKRPRRIERRSSNFFSLLADAQVNRVVLHPKAHSEPKPSTSIIPEKYMPPLPSQEHRCTLRQQEQRAWCGKMSPPPAALDAIFFSDDSLNLFACTTSSPPRC